MTTIKPYIPILRWRPAEIKALERLSPQDRESLTPLIEFVMPAPSVIRQNDKVVVTKTPREKFLEALPGVNKILEESCGQIPVFIDVNQLDADIRASSFERILTSSREPSLFPIPVTYIIPVMGTDADSATRLVAVNYAKTSRHGLCIRIDKSHFKDPDLAVHITNFVKENQLDIGETDLLIDLRIVDKDTSLSEIVDKINKLPELQKWRSFIVAGGVFPKDLTGFAPGEAHPLDRLDWKLWTGLQDAQLPRAPLFSDYVTQHPFYEYVAAIGSASVRYTADGQWWIFRGTKPGYVSRKTGKKGPGREQYIDHAKTLTGHSFSKYFKGANFSFGDAEISRIASPGNTKPGSPTTWLTISINHHLTLAARQVASLFGKI